MKNTKKLECYLPLTNKELVEVVNCYATEFPNWKLIDGNRLERSFGPVVQQIGFEALRAKTYRPMAVIWTLPLSVVSMLHQFLDIKHRQISLREHPVKWKDVVAAMEEQFRPSIREPLDLIEIRDICEQNAKEKTNDLCMLAILYAYLGEKKKALSYCERLQAIELPESASGLNWGQQHKEFSCQLLQAIETGNELEFLDTASSNV